MELVKGLTALGSDTITTAGRRRWCSAKSFGRHTLNLAMRGSGPISDERFRARLRHHAVGRLPAAVRLPATGQLLNERFVYGRLVYNYRLLTVPLFEGLYAGVSAEVGNYGRPLVAGNPTGTLYSGAAFLAFDSPLGPMYLGYGMGTGGNSAAYFYLGRP